MITTFVDDANGAISYVRKRRLLEKTPYKPQGLDQEVDGNMRELRDVRNWSFHLPQTNFVAMKEVYFKNLPKELRQYVKYEFNPIKVGVQEKCSIKFLESLYLHAAKRIEVFETILNSMLRDFEDLLGEEVSVVEIQEAPGGFMGASTVSAQLSMAMNRRKYGGSNEKYEEITFQKPIGDDFI